MQPKDRLDKGDLHRILSSFSCKLCKDQFSMRKREEAALPATIASPEEVKGGKK
jgi:hypothetical protein